VGIWAVVAGAAQIATAFRLRMAGGRIWLLALAAVLSVIAGIVILFWPSAGVIGLAMLLGVFAVVYDAALGAMAVALCSPVP
jgi:uncharacterized membrane protein HdeD (DUF308 family)